MSEKFSPRDRLRSVRFALAGLRTLLAQEHNARVHLAVTIAVVVAGIWLGINREEWIWAAIAVALVWMAEAFNTAIERLGDAITTEQHPQIGIAKDVAAAGVLIASACAAFIGLLIFIPNIVRVVR